MTAEKPTLMLLDGNSLALSNAPILPGSCPVNMPNRDGEQSGAAQ